MKGRWLAAGLAGAAVASCGGGSGGGSGVTVITGVTPTPTPTSSPAPTYQTYAQLTGDQVFKTGCAALRFDFSPPQAPPVTPFGQGLTLAYAAGSQSYTVSADAGAATVGFGSNPRTYGPAERDAAVTTSASYARTTNGFLERLSIGSNSAGGASPDYVRGFSLRVPLFGNTGVNPPAIQYSCIFGVPTRLDDEPRGSAVVTFTRTGLNGTAIVYPPSGAPESYSIARSQVSFSVDLATYRVTTSVRVIGNLVTAAGTSATDVELGTYAGAVTIDESGFYNGLLTSSDRTVRFASWGGWFFGPQGAEGAYSLGITSLDPVTGRQLSLIANALALR